MPYQKAERNDAYNIYKVHVLKFRTSPCNLRDFLLLGIYNSFLNSFFMHKIYLCQSFMHSWEPTER